MKKLLALVLALVMSLSLVTISNAAFDAEDISYNEAVEVLNAVGVFEGDEKGNFNPTAELDRASAAKIIAYLDLGKETADALPAVKVFNDVPADYWAAKYIAYCADAGYLAGVGDGNFNPTGKLTGYAFGKMLLCVLGYEASSEGFLTSSWQIKVAQLMKTKDIADGVSKNASAVLTREEAAQYALNALEAVYVTYGDSTKTEINLGDIGSITVGGSSAKDNEDGEKLYEDLYEKLDKLTGKSDDLGRPAHIWKLNKDVIGTYADKADEVVIAEEDYASVEALYVDVVDEDYKQDEAIKGDKAIKAGDVVELYMNDDDQIKQAVVIRYQLAKVDEVSTKLTKAEKEDNSFKVKLTTVDGKSTVAPKVLEEDFADFDYEEDDVILCVLDGTDKVLASVLAESVEGKVTSVKGDKVAIDGTYYVDLTDLDLDAKGTFYLNAAGQIMASESSVEKSSNYAYIYNTNDTNDTNDDGESETGTKVYYVTVDGVKGVALAENSSEVEKGKVVAFKINSDDEFEVVKENEDIKNNAEIAKILDKSNSKVFDKVYATSKTTFVFVEKDGSKYNVETVVGYKNVKILANATTGVVVDVVYDDGEALYVFVSDANESISSTDYLAVVLNATAEKTKDDDNTYYTYEVAVDGEETTITSKDNKLTFAKGDVFSYDLKDGYVENVKVLTAKDVEVANDDIVIIADDANEYDASKGTIYTVTLDYEDGEIDTVTVSEGGKFDTDNKVVYTTDDGDLDVVFVIEVID